MSNAYEADEERQLLHQMMEELAQGLLAWREKVDQLSADCRLDGERELLECYLPRGADELTHVLRTCRSAAAQYAVTHQHIATGGVQHGSGGNLPCIHCYGTGISGYMKARCMRCQGKGTEP